jgi:cytochrome c5
MGYRNCLSISVSDMEGQMRMPAQSLRFRIILAVAIGLLTTLPAVSARQKPSKDKHSTANHNGAAKNSSSEQSDGEKKFKQNCSRCHEAPEGFTPSISGTVLRHMRVRASLSKQDEQDILRFLNPR